MATDAAIGREGILGALAEALASQSYVHALWEGGAVGFGRLDEWSDIDLYALVDDGKVDEAFATIECALESVSPIEMKYDIGQTEYPGVHQAFYRLEGTSEFMVLDIAVVTLGAPDLFLEEETHGVPRYLFCKIDPPPRPLLDRDSLKLRVMGRARRLRLRMDLFHVFVQKELNRGHVIEAVDLYRNVVLGSLTELLRIRHHPVHHAFQTRYLYNELPSDTVKRLEDLYMVRDMQDLAVKYASARGWFDEVHAEVTALGPDGLIGD